MTTRRDGEVVEDASFPTLKECPPISRYIFHDQSKSGFRDDPLLGKLSEFDHVILSSHIAFYTDQVGKNTWPNIIFSYSIDASSSTLVYTIKSLTQWAELRN